MTVQLTKQEVFDKVATHLLTQMKKAERANPEFDDGKQCVYRTDDGLKCAVGCLIPDELYDKNMEGCDAYALCDNFPAHAVEAGLRDVGAYFLCELQSIHDRYDPLIWRGKLLEFSILEDVDGAVLNNFPEAAA